MRGHVPDWVDGNKDGDAGDGLARQRAVQPLPPAPGRFCSTAARGCGSLRSPGLVPLPACTARTAAGGSPKLPDTAARGSAAAASSTAPRASAAATEIALRGRPLGGDLLARRRRQVRFTVAVSSTPPGVVVRALGDSVTAGFGYYSNGTPMTIGSLLGCRPPEKGYDDACSSNSLSHQQQAKLEYAPDYGLANNISWAAQWANEYGDHQLREPRGQRLGTVGLGARRRILRNDRSGSSPKTPTTS